MEIIHLDVDRHLREFLQGRMYEIPFDLKHIKQVEERESVECISIKSFSHVDNEVLEHTPRLRLIVTRTVGTDHIDLDACKKHSIGVYHIPDYGSYTIAEHAFGLIISGARCIVQSNNQVHTGRFHYEDFLGYSLKDKVLGVVGTGKIGLELVRRGQAFGMHVIACDKKCDIEKGKREGFECVPLDELLQRADVVSLHVPLLPSTKHMMSDAQFAMMKEGSILVNTARGGIIDTQALIRSIGKFKAVCLDVLEDEKSFSQDHPLLAFDNVIITPHIGFYTDNGLRNIARETSECLQRFQSGDDTGRIV